MASWTILGLGPCLTARAKEHGDYSSVTVRGTWGPASIVGRPPPVFLSVHLHLSNSNKTLYYSSIYIFILFLIRVVVSKELGAQLSPPIQSWIKIIKL